MLLRTRGYRSLKIVISFSSDKYSGVGLLDHMVICVFNFLRKFVTVSMVAAPSSRLIIKNSWGQSFEFLHVNNSWSAAFLLESESGWI